MEKTYKYNVKRPVECNTWEIDKFHELVIKGGKVQEKGLKERIKNCLILGFCTYKGETIGISSIKRPQKTYVERIIIKANLDREWNELEYEIGYSFTEKEFRKNGISTQLKTSLIKRMNEIGGRIFSTTAIASSQRFLKEKGFNQVGISYDGDNDKNLRYYELIIKN